MATAFLVIGFLLVISAVIFIHELGHFLAARRGGIFVEEFALGMGPKIFSWHGKKKSHDGQTTLFSLRSFPIGGFCRMRGQDDDMPDDPEALNNKSIPTRALVMAGGSLMNFVLAFMLFFVLIMLRGTPMHEQEIFVAEVVENAPGERAGLRVDDIITHINSARVETQREMIEEISAGGGAELTMRVNRDGASVDLRVTPQFTDGRYMIGFTHGARNIFTQARVRDGIFGAAENIAFLVSGPFQLLSQIIAGEPLAEGEGVVGPIGLGGMFVEVGQAASTHGAMELFLTALFFTAAINAMLGIINLLPIPALDGARLVFLLIEAIRRKPVPPEKEAIVHLVGLVSLMLLAVFIAYRDIIRLVEF